MDEVIKSKMHYQPHTGELTNVQTQPTEDLILHRNAELRKNKGVINDLGHDSAEGSWGRLQATIPNIIYYGLPKKGFDVMNKDAKIAGLEMNRFLQTTEGKMCLVQG